MQYVRVIPYRYGGTTINGIDCSAFVRAIYATQGMILPRTAAEQAGVGYAVPLRDSSQWQVGDRLYFQCHHGYVDHAGMYIGGGYFIHSHAGKGVDVSRVDDAYYWNHLVAVRRSPEMLDDAQTGAETAAPDTEQSQSE
jgi:cell wall-associated NlpC family hydrolase